MNTPLDSRGCKLTISLFCEWRKKPFKIYIGTAVVSCLKRSVPSDSEAIESELPSSGTGIYLRTRAQQNPESRRRLLLYYTLENGLATL